MPLQLCHAATVHSCQGVTAKSPGGVVFNRTDKPVHAAGLCYVAISRCQCIGDLILQKSLALSHFRSHRSVREAIEAEYARLEGLFPQTVTDRELKQRRREILEQPIQAP